MSSDARFSFSEFAQSHMARALELAARGRGLVEPNPMVGGVIVAADGEVVGEGWHQRFGGPHAEIEALKVAGPRARGATLYVTLEPCCHHGKTPPCTQAIIAAGVRQVVAAHRDPFPAVAGGGFKTLEAAGIATHAGLLEAEARALNSPYLKLVTTARPWVIAKWAMSLDGKIAARTGESRWISGEESRRVAHELRGRVDAVIVGAKTAAVDDPLLTARPAGSRQATRIVVDTRAALSPTSQLARTARETPLLVVVGPDAPSKNCDELRAAGCEVFACSGPTREARLDELLAELGRRRMTNVLVEGGGQLLGSLFDGRHVDEIHVFIAPKILGGDAAPGPIAGSGADNVAAALSLENMETSRTGNDLYVRGRTLPPTPYTLHPTP